MHVPEFTALGHPQIVAHQQYYAALDPLRRSIDHVTELPCASHLPHFFRSFYATGIGHERQQLTHDFFISRVLPEFQESHAVGEHSSHFDVLTDALQCGDPCAVVVARLKVVNVGG